MKNLYHILTILGLLLVSSAKAQDGPVDFLNPRSYVIALIEVEGAKTYDENGIRLISGLSKGQEINIPGKEISTALKKLWSQGIFEEVEILQRRVEGNSIFLVIRVKERPALCSYRFKGISKSEAEKIKEKINLYANKPVTENLKMNAANKIKQFFLDKRYFNVQVTVEEFIDTNGVCQNGAPVLVFNVDKGEKTKILEINIEGLSSIDEKKLLRAMKETKERRWWRVWKVSKFLRSNYEADKEAIIAQLRSAGLRDASIVRDSVYQIDEKNIGITIWVDEGSKYYFGDFIAVGNTKFSNSFLMDTVLGIKPGDVYSQERLEARLFMDPNGGDITSLYMDKGYLFFSVTPVETAVRNDTIDFEIRMNEGKVARVRDVRVIGNTKTNDHVIYRMLRTKPGDLFSRDAIIRTQRELAVSGWFDPEKLNVNPIPDPVNGTVDIEYIVEERPSDQIELSGGWGGGRLVGTLGLSFNNFSVRKMFKGPWNPLPSGDGQRLSIRAQSNGLFWQSYNFSFTEPWLGGKKPNALSVSAYYSQQSNGVRKGEEGRSSLGITGVSIGLGQMNKWPDDYFTNQKEIGYQHYQVSNYGQAFIIDNGSSDAYYFRWALNRNSLDQNIYPKRGSSISFSIKATPPWSLFDDRDDYSDLPDEEKYRLIEYNKWKLTASWFTPLSKDQKLVLNTRFGFGFLHYYSQSLGPAPFERFILGGSGLTGFNIQGSEIIALRGYPDQGVSPQQGDPLIAKYTMELRYPLSLNPNATVYLLGFAEAGNTWGTFREFNPFQVKRSAGIGVRIFLPMFGLLGLDYGWGFDSLEPGKQASNSFIPRTGQFHFTIGTNIGEL